jgi:hypothetical protein
VEALALLTANESRQSLENRPPISYSWGEVACSLAPSLQLVGCSERREDGSGRAAKGAPTGWLSEPPRQHERIIAVCETLYC